MIQNKRNQYEPFRSKEQILPKGMIFVALRMVRSYRRKREAIQKKAVWAKTPERRIDEESEDEPEPPEALPPEQEMEIQRELGGWTKVDGGIGSRYIYRPHEPIPVPQTFNICNQWPNFVPPNFYPPPLARSQDGQHQTERNLSAYPRLPVPPMLPQGYLPANSSSMLTPPNYIAGPPFPNQFGTPKNPACWMKCNQY